MVGIINTGSFPKLLLPGINALVGAAYGAKDPQWNKIFKTYNSNMNYEFDVMQVPTGLVPVKAQGAAIEYDSMIQSFEKRYVHAVYASGLIITKEELDDNLYESVVQKRAEVLGRSMAITKEQVAADILNNGFSSSFLGGDGVALFSASHPYMGGVYSNTPSVASDLSESALEQAMIDIYNFIDQRGKPINVMAQKLVIPASYTFEAQRILKSPLRVATADNDMNAMKDMGYMPEGIHVNRFLTDSDAWFIVTDCPDGLKHFQRWPLQVGSDNDFDTFNLRFKIFERYCFGWTDPRGAYGSPGA